MAKKKATNNKNKQNGQPVFYLCKCDCGYEMSISADDLVSGKATSCGCEKLDHLLQQAPQIKIDGDTAICHFSTVENQDKTFLVDAEDIDIVEAADWYMTYDGHVRGRDKKTGEYYLLEEQVVYKHHDKFFNI